MENDGLRVDVCKSVFLKAGGQDESYKILAKAYSFTTYWGITFVLTYIPTLTARIHLSISDRFKVKGIKILSNRR